MKAKELMKMAQMMSLKSYLGDMLIKTQEIAQDTTKAIQRIDTMLFEMYQQNGFSEAREHRQNQQKYEDGIPEKQYSGGQSLPKGKENGSGVEISYSEPYNYSDEAPATDELPPLPEPPEPDSKSKKKKQGKEEKDRSNRISEDLLAEIDAELRAIGKKK